MARIRCLSVAIVMFLVSGCGVVSVMNGSGNVSTESRSVSAVKAVTLNGSGQLIINQTGNETLSITADDNLLPYLTSEVSGSHLMLGVKDNASINPTKPVVYRLEVKNLAEIVISGSGTVSAAGIVTDQLKIEASGSTRVSAFGEASRLELSISGSGDYQGADLKSKEAKISITGSGDTVVSASEKLDVTVTGSGSVEYIGDPVVTKVITGSGSIHKR